MQLRKLIHLSGAAFAFVALLNPYVAVLGILAGILAFSAFEALKGSANLPLLSSLYRDGERAGVASEPLLYLLSIAILLIISLFFLPSACYAAIVVLTVGDGIASLAGRPFGKHKLPYSVKSWEGSLAGLLAAAAVGFLFAGPLAIAGAAAGMAAEAYSRRLENLSIAAAAFLAMAVLSLAP